MINYYILTKPGIVLGNLVTVAAGFLLASRGGFDVGLFLAALLGLALIVASACVFNNYIDRHIDGKMARTKNRPLVQGLITVRHAILFAIALGMLGGITLLAFTNLLTFALAATGFFVYVVLYSLWKCRTVYGTAIGSIAGAVPPVVGYCAVSDRFDAGALILFAMMVLWQMPHFFAIALFRYEDYAAAGIPVLPIAKGIYRTKVHMLLYVLGFLICALMLTVFNYTGYLYFTVALASSLAWALLCFAGFYSQNNQEWGRRMFHFSLLLITAISLAIPLDVI